MSTLHVENLKGLSSGGNANKIIVPSGQTLTAAGHVIQVVSSNKTDQTQITASSYTDTGLSVSITPKFSTSKIFVNVSCFGICYNTQYIAHRLLRDSTAIYVDFGYNNNNYWMPVNYHIGTLDSPSTASAITYKTQCYQSHSGLPGDIRYNYSGAGGPHTASITAMEIAQ